MPRKFFIIWELPQILLALILYVIFKKRITKTIYYKDSKVFFVKDFPGGVSLSFIIFLNEADWGNEGAVKHEHGHTVQSLYLGWLYLVIVGLPSLIRAGIWKHYGLENSKYYDGFPENWSDLLGGVNKKEDKL